MSDQAKTAAITEVSELPRVAVVLCSFCGEAHIEQQLDSLAAQTWPIDVFVHDDASDDDTLTLAKAHRVDAHIHEHHINGGYVANFARGLQAALSSGADYIALCDQDDIWAPDRIEAGMRELLTVEDQQGQDHPILVHSDLTVIDHRGVEIAPSYFQWRGYDPGHSPNLGHILGVNGVMGNTCLINRALADLALPFPAELHVHDWWLGVLAELYGTRRLTDRPTVAYRLHANNASNPAGSVAPSAFRILQRLSMSRLLARDFKLPFKEDTRERVLSVLLAGDAHRPAPDAESRAIIEAFVTYLRLSLPRWKLLLILRQYRFLKRGLRHRLRVTAALLSTGRYSS